MKLSSIDWVAAILTIVGGVNWGLVGLLNLDLVALIFGEGSSLSRIVYVVVGISAVYLIFALLKLNGGKK